MSLNQRRYRSRYRREEPTTPEPESENRPGRYRQGRDMDITRMIRRMAPWAILLAVAWYFFEQYVLR